MRHYYFHSRFSTAILAGKKAMTIRRVWSKRVQKGDALCLHIDISRSGDVIVMNTYCSDAYPVRVTDDSIEVRERKLSPSEIRKFYRDDGFRSLADMKAFFAERYSLPFCGQCICWKKP